MSRLHVLCRDPDCLGGEAIVSSIQAASRIRQAHATVTGHDVEVHRLEARQRVVADGGKSSTGTARYSDPITEIGGYVGRGAVLYDTRDPERRPCCNQGGRCLAHVVGVYEETTTGKVYYKVADGTWTTEEWINGDDLLAIFEPAGWSVIGVKPTYLLTREHGVEDHHDLMTDGGTSNRGNQR